MKCEMFICIYNEKSEYLLRSIKIDVNGSCEECVLPNIPSVIIDGYKKDLLKKMQERQY